MDDDDLIVCPGCRQEVVPDDVCPEHEVCLWCDSDCKFALADQDE